MNFIIFHGINFAKIFKLKYLLRIFRHIESIKKKKKQEKKIDHLYAERIKNKDYAFFDTIQLLSELQINNTEKNVKIRHSIQ